MQDSLAPAASVQARPVLDYPAADPPPATRIVPDPAPAAAAEAAPPVLESATAVVPEASELSMMLDMMVDDMEDDAASPLGLALKRSLTMDAQVSDADPHASGLLEDPNAPPLSTPVADESAPPASALLADESAPPVSTPLASAPPVSTPVADLKAFHP